MKFVASATLWRADLSAPPCPRPLAADGVRAGFAAPVQDFSEQTLDINDYLVRNAPATFYVQVEGHSMDGAGIHHGDMLVVDRSIPPRDGHIVIAFVDGERLVKTLRLRGSRGWLVAAHPDYPPLPFREGQQAEIWGVVVGRFARIKA